MENLNPQEIHTRIKETAARVRQQNEGQKVTYSREAVMKSAVDTLEAVNFINQLFHMVGSVAGYFSIEKLKEEGKTDTSKLDLKYYTLLGQQIVTDFKQLASEATLITGKAKEIHRIYNKLINSHTLTESEQLTLGVDGIEIQTECADFALKFQSVISSAVVDIINHLNLGRSPEDQVSTSSLTSATENLGATK